MLVVISQPQQMPGWRGAGWVGSQTGTNPRLMSKSRFGPCEIRSKSENFYLFRFFSIKKRFFCCCVKILAKALLAEASILEFPVAQFAAAVRDPDLSLWLVLGLSTDR